MRYLALIGLLVLLGGACKRRPHPNPAATIEEETDLSNVVNVLDARDSSQLLNGFHAVESGGWRWSMKKFAVSLGPPPVVGRSTKLSVTFSVPDVVSEKMTGTALTATLGGRPLGVKKIEKSGEQTLTFDVPADALRGQGFIVQFELDRAIGPTASDSRELGVIVSRVGTGE